jgi:hypothetical protein
MSSAPGPAVECTPHRCKLLLFIIVNTSCYEGGQYYVNQRHVPVIQRHGSALQFSRYNPTNRPTCSTGSMWTSREARASSTAAGASTSIACVNKPLSPGSAGTTHDSCGQ